MSTGDHFMMKTSLLTAVLMTSVFALNQASAGILNMFEDSKKAQTAVKDVYAGLKFHYLDRADRLMIVKDFLNSIELEYALLPLKEKRLGIDFQKIKEEAIDAEMAAGDFILTASERKNQDAREKMSFLQAQSNMEFMDRMTLLVAKFKDTHFGINEKISRPYIYNGVRLFRVQGRIIIGSLDKKFLAMVEKLSGTDMSPLKIGEEVVSIDGVPVEKKIDEYKPYVAGSTDEYIDMEAVRALTLRNFKYEKKNFVKITFKSGLVFKLPVFVNNSMQSTPRVDAITYFEKYKIPSDSSSIGITFDKTTGKFVEGPSMAFSGYSARNLKENLKGVTEMVDDAGSPAIRTGYFINKGKTYAVMQLMTFYTKNVKTATAEMPFLDAIRNFAIDAKENELPVILDLRINGGGNGGYPAAVLSIFTEADKTYGGPSRGYRVTPYMRYLEEQQNFQFLEGEDQSVGITYDDLRNIMDEALDAGKPFAPMFNVSGNVTADAKVKGFKEKMVVLVTPNCVSACDMTAFLFKESKRATIIGTSTNGTGAGFRSSNNLNTEWEDPLRVFSSTIPNFLFGRPGDLNTSIFGENSVDELCSENQPTIADIPYSNMPIDIVKGNLGWLQKAVQVLETK